MKNRDATEKKACKQISVDFGKLMGGIGRFSQYQYMF